MPSTSSFLDLKAELAKQEAEFARSRAAGKDAYMKGGVQRPDKKPTIWARQNKGIAMRNARDLEWSLAEKPVLEAAKAALERKAIQYEKLKRGKTAGLSEQQFDALLVDFDRKADEEGFDSDDSADVDESLSVPQRPNNESDPMIEYEDEFGRMRTARQSEVPRNLLPQEKEPSPEYDPYLINDPNYFPTFEPSAEKVAEIEATLQEENPATHYDATGEVRPRGAAFYQFSKDEETRQRQMEELKKSRDETEKAREESGAASGKEIKPGAEKRKRDIEERRKAIEAKRRKKEMLSQPASTPAAEPAQNVSAAEASTSQADIKPTIKRVKKPKPKLEPKSKEEIARSADEFLASLERDMASGRSVL